MLGILSLFTAGAITKFAFNLITTKYETLLTAREGLKEENAWFTFDSCSAMKLDFPENGD